MVCLNSANNLVWRLVQSYLYQTDETLRWHAMEAIAIFSRRRWDSGYQERVVDFIRRLLWSISDESGGIGWSAPQTIAEIIVAIPQLSEPYVNIMIDRAFSEPPLIKSGLWAIGRLGRNARQSAELFQDVIMNSFSTDDPETLGLAAWALGEIGLKPALPCIQALKDRKEPVRIYITPYFCERQLESWAMEAASNLADPVD